MADVPYARWYDEGTAAFTKGSTTVTGTSTFWLSAGVKAGDIFIDPTGKIYEIANVDSSTQITLRKSYAGDTGTGKGYSIIRMFSSTMNATLANQLATLLSEFERRYNLDMQTIIGKSAYDIAKDNGFNGTQAEWLESLSAYGVAVKNGYSGTAAEWLESLKAAGEWTTLNDRTQILTTNNLGYKNCMYRGKNLGDAVTDEQYNEIKNHTWNDLYLGDYWVINGHRYTIAEFSDTCMSTAGGQNASDNRPSLIILASKLGAYPMNDTDYTSTPYFLNTTMVNETIPALIESAIDPDFRNLAVSHREWEQNGISGQLSWTTKATLIRYDMVTGNFWTGLHQHVWQEHRGKILPLFHFVPILPGLSPGSSFWTSTLKNSTYFLRWDRRGESNWNTNPATQANNVILWFYAG